MNIHENRHISVVVGWARKRRKALKYKGTEKVSSET